jgi:hypothetical protein
MRYTVPIKNIKGKKVHLYFPYNTVHRGNKRLRPIGINSNDLHTDVDENICKNVSLAHISAIGFDICLVL